MFFQNKLSFFRTLVKNNLARYPPGVKSMDLFYHLQRLHRYQMICNTACLIWPTIKWLLREPIHTGIIHPICSGHFYESEFNSSVRCCNDELQLPDFGKVSLVKLLLEKMQGVGRFMTCSEWNNMLEWTWVLKTWWAEAIFRNRSKHRIIYRYVISKVLCKLPHVFLIYRS